MSPVRFEYYPPLPAARLVTARDNVLENAAHWDDPFFQNPRNLVNLDQIKDICDPILADHEIQHVVVLGTGGSIQTMMALAPFATREFVPLWSSRASELARAKKRLSSDHTCVIPISRGGKTLDVNSVLGEFAGYPMVALSSQGPMYDLVRSLDVPILPVPDLSGRFAGSCSNVGIVPAYMAGIPVRDFLAGLERGYARNAIKGDPEDNPALQFAAFLYQLHQKGFRNVFSMPYVQWLEGVLGLFVQEISESTGKEGKGLLGTSQPAPLCQHSVLELLLGGSKGHTVPVVWNVDEDPDDFALESPLEDVNGRSAHEIITFQAEATFQAILQQGVPAAQVLLERPTVEQLGELVAYIQNTVYFTCCMLDVNWANNPTVVTGKKICNEALAEDLDETARRANRRGVSQAVFPDFWK